VIEVTDKFPSANLKDKDPKVHNNLEFAMTEYSNDPSKWKIVEMVLLKSGFTPEVKEKISKAVYDALLNFVKKATGGSKENALVLVKADKGMAFRDADTYGGFGKRGKAKIEPASFKQAVWTSSFGGTTEKEKLDEVKRAVNAIISMATS